VIARIARWQRFGVGEDHVMANINQLLGSSRAFAHTDARRNVPAWPLIPRQNLDAGRSPAW
jgi:hypothetical protein